VGSGFGGRTMIGVIDVFVAVVPVARVARNNHLRLEPPNLPKDEIARRVRAVSYGPFQPYIEIAGYRFEYKPDHK
ncbi:MAG TPA: hypothetical protein VMJ64_12540, partial [Anaerolineales bacterium]|nr:hypothetical protein [Anaerolineales bacterium]